MSHKNRLVAEASRQGFTKTERDIHDNPDGALHLCQDKLGTIRTHLISLAACARRNGLEETADALDRLDQSTLDLLINIKFRLTASSRRRRS